jgi:opacity protein-like surface antigen
MKSLLLGSAAALVVAAGAQAADLPTKKGAPAVEYVKVCKIDGMAGFVLPGSDTCFKISGYMTAQVTAGNLSQQYLWDGGFPAGIDEIALKHGTPTNERDQIGYTNRFSPEFIAKSNTPYGVLTADITLRFEYGSGFDNTGAGVGYIDQGFVNWAGITAGKHASFFSFYGGGEGWANLDSPDRQGFNEPFMLAYTGTFGGGFSATLALEDPQEAGPSGGGTRIAATDATYLGLRWPDVVLSLDLAQGWGGAHLAGVVHDNNMIDLLGHTLNRTGGAIDGGLKFNLPTLGAGDNIQMQAQWSKNAVWYSGIPDMMWGENGQVNGNGVVMPVADAFSFLNGDWASPTAWGVSALGEFHFGPTFAIDPEIGYAHLSWSGNGGAVLGGIGNYISDSNSTWMGGAVFHWDPVVNLDFNLELLYQTTHQTEPAIFVAGTPATCAAGGFCPWKATSSGLEGRFEITRSW